MKERPMPVVSGRYALWPSSRGVGRVEGLADDEELITNIVDAKPSHRERNPGPSITPFLLALATSMTIIACIYTPWGLVYGATLMAITLTAWYWPRRTKVREGDLAAEQP
jgi:cytochrome c oxidase subunit 1